MAETPFEELCVGLPIEFMWYMEYCRVMDYEEEPDYNFLINLFQSCIDKCEAIQVNNWDELNGMMNMGGVNKKV